MANWQKRVASLSLQNRLSMIFSVWTVLLSFSRVDCLVCGCQFSDPWLCCFSVLFNIIQGVSVKLNLPSPKDKELQKSTIKIKNGPKFGPPWIQRSVVNYSTDGIIVLSENNQKISRYCATAAPFTVFRDVGHCLHIFDVWFACMGATCTTMMKQKDCFLVSVKLYYIYISLICFNDNAGNLC